MSDQPFSASFTEWEARVILEALTHEEERLREAIAVSQDEDEISDLDNDLVQLRSTLDRFKDAAVNRFGPGVANFDKGAL
jgi:hypothetical protein